MSQDLFATSITDYDNQTETLLFASHISSGFYINAACNTFINKWCQKCGTEKVKTIHHYFTRIDELMMSIVQRIL